jgi:hypothetical protein
MEIGVMFWAGRDNLAELRALGVQSGQLGVGGDIPLTSDAAAEWREAIGEAKFSIATVVCAYTGEDYAANRRIHSSCYARGAGTEDHRSVQVRRGPGCEERRLPHRICARGSFRF